MRMFRTLLGAMGLALLTVVAFAQLPALAAFTTPRPTFPIVDTTPISRAVAYLDTTQRADGGFEGFTAGTSDDFTTLKVVFALNAARLPADTITSTAGLSALDYLETRAYSYTHDLSARAFPGRLGLMALAAVAGDADPAAFSVYPAGHPSAGAPIDLPAAIAATYRPATGAYSSTAQLGFSSGAAGTLTQSYALLGLSAAQAPIPAQAVAYLRSLQEPDGGWGFGFGGDTDTTAIVVQALIAAGVAPTDADIQAGLAFLRGQQLPGATWGFEGTPSPDATAFVIQAAAAAGFTPAGASWATAESTPRDALIALQQADGSFGGNALGTAHAIAGLAEMPLPLLGRAQRAERALAAISAAQTSSGAWSFFGAPSIGGTIDAALAFSAAGYDPDRVLAPGGASALDFLASQVLTYTRDVTGTVFPAQTGKLILAVVAARANPIEFGSGPGAPFDLLADLEGTYVAATGAYSTTAVRGFSSGAATPLSQSFAILGLRAARLDVPNNAITFLRDRQLTDGSWGSVDTTALVIQAMRAAGVPGNDTGIVTAIAFLRAQQDAVGGWGNPNSTAYAIQGLLAAGENLQDNWRKGGRSPYEALALYQKPDGPFTYTWESEPFFTPGETNDLATWQAVPALLGVSFPIRPTALAAYSAAARGPDPNRMAAAPAFGRWGNSISVSVPFGSDLDSDGSATLQWRPVGETAWTTAALTRGSGVFTATLNVDDPVAYELRATFSDPDGVQAGGALTPTAVLTSTVEPFRLYLPLARR